MITPSQIEQAARKLHEQYDKRLKAAGRSPRKSYDEISESLRDGIREMARDILEIDEILR